MASEVTSIAKIPTMLRRCESLQVYCRSLPLVNAGQHSGHHRSTMGVSRPPAPKRGRGQRARPKERAKRDLGEGRSWSRSSRSGCGSTGRDTPLGRRTPSRSRPSQQRFDRTTRPTQSAKTARRRGPTAQQRQQRAPHFRGRQGTGQKAWNFGSTSVSWASVISARSNDSAPLRPNRKTGWVSRALCVFKGLA